MNIVKYLIGLIVILVVGCTAESGQIKPSPLYSPKASAPMVPISAYTPVATITSFINKGREKNEVMGLSPTVAMDSKGNFMITYYKAENGLNIFAKTFDSTGKAISKELKVNTSDCYCDSYHTRLTIATDNQGTFIISWSKFDDLNDKTVKPEGVNNVTSIYARRFKLNGDPLENEFKINSFLDAEYYMPDISMNDSGDFVIAWTGTLRDPKISSTGNYYNKINIYYQKFNSKGHKVGNENNILLKSHYGKFYFYYPKVKIDRLGNFILIWNDIGAISLKKFNSKTEENIYLPDFITGLDSASAENGEISGHSLAMDKNGNFIVICQKTDEWYHDPLLAYLSAYIFDNNLNIKVNNLKIVDKGFDFSKFVNQAVMQDINNFTVFFSGKNQNSTYGIFGRRYKNSNLEDIFRVNQYLGQYDSKEYLNFSASGDASGNSIVAWDSTFFKRYNNEGNVIE